MDRIMRPDALQPRIIEVLTRAGINARPADGPEGSGMRYGIVVASQGGESGWQIAGRLAPGDRWDAPVPQPVTGTAPARVDPPAAVGGVADVEHALAAAVTRMDGSDEVASVGRYSVRERPPVVGYGLRIEFHDGSAAFVQLRGTR